MAQDGLLVEDTGGRRLRGGGGGGGGLAMERLEAAMRKAEVEPWLDTSTPDPDTTPTLPRHYPDTSTLRHQCQPTLGPTLRHQCQASVKPSRQWTSSYSVNGVK